MKKIRQSYDGIKSIVSNAIAFIAGNNDDDSLSSAEVIECDSDCSQCCSPSENNTSHRQSKVSHQSKPKAIDELVEGLQGSSSKRFKRNSDSSIEEEE